MVFQDFLSFLVFLETSEVAGPGPNPREIEISFGADGPLACARPDPTIGWTDVLPCVFVCVWGRYPPAAALLVRRLVVPVLNKLLQLPLHPLAGAWRVLAPLTYYARADYALYFFGHWVLHSFGQFSVQHGL